MQTSDVVEQKIWDDFVTANGSEFLQSWDWGVLQESLGRKIWRLAVTDENQIKAVALIVKHQLPFKQNYLYCPRGPLTTEPKYFEYLVERIKELGKHEKSTFCRIEPISPTINYHLPPTKPVQPKTTLVLDLTKSEDDILNSFHQKTRYNIRLAEKHGVTVRDGSGDQDFEIFWNLLTKTYTKQEISTHPKEYYKKILTTPYSLLATKLFIAESNGIPVAANLCYFYGDRATYAHGGSDYQYRNLMAPHLLQWHQIKCAKDAGYKVYDFWGIDEKRWPGVTRFKLGFNGKSVDYPGTFDIPISKILYPLYKLVKKVK
ncbi:MAG: peptidoglycan bridge formation glycyltransferase FemA/FemB family protein [Patescibacteria group bacterium]|jgi:lipid II:glycine glycyltransferase (peptidoglycan interpeptide bridge formation enzyme)